MRAGARLPKNYTHSRWIFVLLTRMTTPVIFLAMGTKGTWRRPAAITDDELQRKWDAAFAAVPLPPVCWHQRADRRGHCPDCDMWLTRAFRIDEPPTNR